MTLGSFLSLVFGWNWEVSEMDRNDRGESGIFHVVWIQIEGKVVNNRKSYIKNLPNNMQLRGFANIRLL